MTSRVAQLALASTLLNTEEDLDAFRPQVDDEAAAARSDGHRTTLGDLRRN